MAGECGYRSMLVAFGVTESAAQDYEVLHYEAPFGVGYMVAQIAREHLTEPKKSIRLRMKLKLKVEQRSSTGGAELLALARRAIETFVREGRVIEKPSSLRSDAQSARRLFRLNQNL